MGNVLQILNYAATYRGNFIDSLDVLDAELHKRGVKNVYLFMEEASHSGASVWINEMICQGCCVYFLTEDKKKNKKILRDIIRDENISVIHTHFITMQHYLFVSEVVNPMGLKIIMHFHNHARRSKNVLKNYLRRYIYRKCVMVGVSESVSDGLREVYPRNRVVCINNAINFERLHCCEKISLREDYGWNTSTVCLVFGFDFYRKGVDLAVKAIQKLRNEGKEIVLCISLSTNEDYVKRVICSMLGTVPEWICILKARNDVASYYCMADVFLSPSREEGFCYSVVEAAYCGSAVVASVIPAQENLKVPEVAWFETENVDDLANKINFVMESTPSLSLEEKQIMLREEYNLNRWAAKVISIYEEGE